MEAIANIIVNGIFLMLGIGYIAHQIRLMGKKLDEVIKSEHECRESLPFKFAVKQSVDDLWARTDDIDAKVNFLRGKINGNEKCQT